MNKLYHIVCLLISATANVWAIKTLGESSLTTWGYAFFVIVVVWALMSNIFIMTVMDQVDKFK